MGFAVHHRTKRMVLRAAIAFLREGAILLVVFGLIDGMVGHAELAKLHVDWMNWMIVLVVVAVGAMILSLVLEHRMMREAAARRGENVS